MNTTYQYVAFLRGINVGGNVLIKMSDLVKVFSNAGFLNVKTVLASGNIIFESSQNSSKKVENEIETALQEKYNRNIYATVRSMKEIIDSISKNPFAKTIVTKDTRLYVTFLKEFGEEKIKVKAPQSEFFKIIKTTNREIYSVLFLSKDVNSIDLMQSFEKEFGKNITTRNWNTISKIAKLSK